MRGHRVATMAKYKGDKAKKEFSIDNTVELNRIRDKYAEQLTTEDDKRILPSFFGWVARQKGYYDSKHKAYLQHDTSMDYLQTIVRRFKTKNRIPDPTSRLIDIFDMTNYRKTNVNKKQISHIMKYVKWYTVEVNKLFSDHYYIDPSNINDYEETRYEKYHMFQEELINHINQYRIGFSTMVFIIKHFELKEYYRYRNILLPLFFTVCNQSFVESVIQSQKDIDVLVEGGTDISLFDYEYSIVKNDQFK